MHCNQHHHFGHTSPQLFRSQVAMARVSEHVPCTALYVENVEESLQDVMAFLEALGDVHRDGFSVTCLVKHPDKLACLFKAEVRTR